MADQEFNQEIVTLVSGFFFSHFNTQKRTLYLPSSDEHEEWPSRPAEVFGSMSGWPWQKIIEAAGNPYEELRKLGQFSYYKSLRYSDLTGSAEKDGNEDDAEEADEPDEEGDDAYKKKKKKSMIITDDYYEILGLGELRWKCTPKDIKDAYRKMVLLYHPDKNQDVTDEAFKKVQKAYDTLSDERKKRIYDSQEEVDVRIPTKVEGDDFYTTFRPVFDRFAKYSVQSPVPSLGDDKTPIERVQRFYSFWTNFKSWRDFSFLDEYDMNDAECREEKRWMERQNKRKKEKKKREEKAKVNRLIEIAESLDPRILKWRKALEDEKRQAREARLAEQKRKQDEIERIAREEKERKEAEEKARQDELLEQKKARERQQKAIKRNRTRLRALCKTNTQIAIENVEKIIVEATPQRLAALCKALETAQQGTDTSAFLSVFNQELSAVQNEIDERDNKKQQEQQPQTPQQSDTKAVKSWSEDELSLLAKGLVKYPGGLRDRWQRISELLGTRTPQEVVAKTQEAKTSRRPQELNKTSQQATNDAYYRFQRTRKEVEIESGESMRFVDDLDVPPPWKEGQEEEDSDEEDGGEVSIPQNVAPTPAVAKSSSVPSPASTPKAGTPKASPSSTSSTSSATSSPAPSPSSTASPAPSLATPSASPSAAATEWNTKQQKQLEAALARFPASLGVERWEKIAQHVSGKTKKDCVLRFKYLAEMVKAKAGKK